MDGFRHIAPPPSLMPSGLQAGEFSPDVSHGRHENQSHPAAEGVQRRQFNGAALVEKHPLETRKRAFSNTAPNLSLQPDVGVRKPLPPREERQRGRESAFRAVLTTVSGFFKRSRGRNVATVADPQPEIDRLQREVTALQQRCANLEGAKYSIHCSCRSSTFDVHQGLPKSDAEISQSIFASSENSECQHVTTDVVVQTIAIPSGNNGHGIPAHPRLTVLVPTRAEGQAEPKDGDPAIQPSLPQAAEDELSSSVDHQSQSDIALVNQGAMVPEPAGHDEGISETSEVLSDQSLQIDQWKSPWKPMEGEESVGAVPASKAHSVYTDQRLPRRRRGNEALELNTLPPPVYQERFPRKKGGLPGDRSRLK